ncbi:cadmium-translocating P-type ATPase [Sphingobacterium psychroaquaticum]|uniref:heavy metal translocating P-type ATPase n=1 Tax=Sphingobacterium psychroaquaticum TaxID=561061 RepID=UPI00106D83D3|nr:heavy metal translocating P-type ATPase [Sphingobacterium psychroaquaticum]QBQ40278.1 cadmium-translocating P-type ATPase [Sphingobacterium psychroaquaticum]
MEHQHEMKNGACAICGQTEKVYMNAGAGHLIKDTKTKKKKAESHAGHDHDHDHSHELEGGLVKLFTPAIISLVLLLTALALDHWVKPDWFAGWVRFIWYVLAYVPVGLPVLKDAYTSILRGNFFSEFFLMGIATLGAFAIAEYPEAVAVMLFYAVGENFQTLSVSRAKANIKALLDQRPDEATIRVGAATKVIKAEEVTIDDVILLKPGEKLALDGVLISSSASFNTAALTGESKPDTKKEGEAVLAGMINLNTASEVRVTAAYEDSKLSKILKLVEDATAQKAPTELFISKFANIYTPIVVFLAIAIALLPALFVQDYEFRDWLYRGLIFLVISCPCALVISIPLGYFGGIGAASKNGVLVKGSNFLDVLASVKHVVMDKTGTMTEGVFAVQEIHFKNHMDQATLMRYVDAIESYSTHPVATAIHQYVGEEGEKVVVSGVEEVAGRGLRGLVENKELLVGNFKLLDKFDISYDVDPNSIVYTTIAVAYDGLFQGYLTIADKIKEDAAQTIKRLHDLGVQTTMLSGDKSTVVKYVADQLEIDNAYGDLLPEDKVAYFKDIKVADGAKVAFVGDGVNDAPVVALSDVGIAMGGLGSDATIETADVVIQDDKPSRIPVAINIGKRTKQIVWQNITMAFVVKAIVLVLGAGGLATMWEAVFADVGVALLAILNAVRIQRMKF